MPGKNKHIKNSLSDFLNYLKGKLSGRERNAFEKELQKDLFSEEALEGFESLGPGELEEDLLRLNARLGRRLEKKNRMLYFRIAATIAIILTVSTLYFTLSDRQLEEFQGPRAVTEAVKEEESNEQEYREPAAKKDQGMDSEREEKSIDEKPDEGAKTDKGKSEEDFIYLEKDKTKTEAQEGVIVIAAEDSYSETQEIIVQPEVAEAEVAAAEIQEEAIRVPETKAPISATQPAVSRKRSFAKMAISDVPVSNEITGKVISAEDSMPLQGVNVRVRGTNTGTVTDSEGNFIIRGISEENPKLVADFIGMESKEVIATTNEDIQITMEPSVMALDEVVLIGSGREPTDQVSGAVSEIEDLDTEINNTYRGAYPVEGTGQFKDYIEENIIYPDSAIDRAVVVLKFVVSQSGRPSQIEVLKSPAETFSKEAIRLLQEGPDWVPAENEGQYIEDKTRIRIVFKKQP